MIDVEQARALYHEHDAAHGFEHVLRVWRMALRIAREEGADLEIVSAAALLHDVGRAEE
ncbi:MAG: HD domain-containing protein, partial [Chloroflexi bacterium]|nr:HD domain-containing protein [Chloroflexota bacterium]